MPEPNMTAILPETRHEAVWEWLLGCPYIGDLFFNATRAEDGNTQLVPSESVIARYIDGTKMIQYDVALTRVMPLSNDPNDTANIASLVDFEKVAEWVDTHLPVFPEGYTVNTVEVLPSMSGFIAAQDMDSAKYMLQFRIEYTH